MNAKQSNLLSRREFARRLAGAGAAGMLAGKWNSRAAEAIALPPTSVFSKVYQELRLNFDDSAAVTAEAGLDGIDCAARPGGQVLPERVADDLPRYAEALAKHQRKILLLTTGIDSLNTPHAEAVLRAAAKLGVKYYRMGYWRYRDDQPPEARLEQIKAQLKDLAALNREIGVCALLQNHAGRNQVGAKVNDYRELVRDLDPAQVAIAFDPGHAINELGENWRAEFEALGRHFAIAYVKDWKPGSGWVPFGTGELGNTEFFRLLRERNYRAPLSVHVEYNWAGDRENRTRERLIQAIQSDLTVLKRWWTES